MKHDFFTIKALTVDGDPVSTSNPMPVAITSGATNTTATNIVDSSGVAYSGSNPIPVTVTSGATATSAVNIVDSSGVAYSGSNRIPTRNIQARGALLTAYVTEDEIQEVSLLAGVSGEYHDLVYVLAANESTAAINLDIRQSTGGTVQMSLEVPANGTTGVALPVPIPQDHADATWTVKNSASDNSNTVYSVTALFAKEV